MHRDRLTLGFTTGSLWPDPPLQALAEDSPATSTSPNQQLRVDR